MPLSVAPVVGRIGVGVVLDREEVVQSSRDFAGIVVGRHFVRGLG